MRKKYRIAETVRVEFLCDAEDLNSAIKQYLKHFQSRIGVNDAIEIVESDDFTSQCLINGQWTDIEEELDALCEKGVQPIEREEVDTPPDDDVKGLNWNEQT